MTAISTIANNKQDLPGVLTSHGEEWPSFEEDRLSFELDTFRKAIDLFTQSMRGCPRPVAYSAARRLGSRVGGDQQEQIMAQRPPRLLVLALSAVFFVAPGIDTALACTRTLYVGADNTVITGRNMDWMEDMASNLWVFPAGLKRDGAAGPRSIQWTSKYGSVVVSGYEAGSVDRRMATIRTGQLCHGC